MTNSDTVSLLMNSQYYEQGYKQGYKQGVSDVLDNIRAEIEGLTKTYTLMNHIDAYVKENDVKDIIDKYRKRGIRNVSM